MICYTLCRACEADVISGLLDFYAVLEGFICLLESTRYTLLMISLSLFIAFNSSIYLISKGDKISEWL